jgi:hypothetical protein
LHLLRSVLARAEEEAGVALAGGVAAEHEARRVAALEAAAWTAATEARRAAEGAAQSWDGGAAALLALASLHAGRLRATEASLRRRQDDAQASAERAMAEAAAARRALGAIQARCDRVDARLAADSLARRAARAQRADEDAAEVAAAWRHEA